MCPHLARFRLLCSHSRFLLHSYWNQGWWKEAKELELLVMEMRKRVLGEEHPDSLMSIGNLASTYWNQGR